jgi:hypothetical protein
MPEEQLNRIYLAVLKNFVRNYQGQEKQRQCALLRAIVRVIILLFSSLPLFSLIELLQVHWQVEQDILPSARTIHSADT